MERRAELLEQQTLRSTYGDESRILDKRQGKLLPDTLASQGPFCGDEANADIWLDHLIRYAQFQKLFDEDTVRVFRVLLRDDAAQWLQDLKNDLSLDLESLTEAFKNRFFKMPELN